MTKCLGQCGGSDSKGWSVPKRTRSTPQQLKFTEPPMRGFFIHLTVYIAVMVGLAALNLSKNPTHLWFLWVLLAWGIALAGHDLLLLIKSRPKKADPSSAKHLRQNQNG